MDRYEFFTDEDIHGCEEDDEKTLLKDRIEKLRNELLDAYDIIYELKEELKNK